MTDDDDLPDCCGMLATGMDTLEAGAAVGISAQAARKAARRKHGLAAGELKALMADLQSLMGRVDRWLSLAQRTCLTQRRRRAPVALSRARAASERCVLAYTLQIIDPCSAARAPRSSAWRAAPH